MLYPEFKVHMLNDLGKRRALDIAEHFDYLLSKVAVECTGGGVSREMSIVRTKLEEACFFAKKAMARNPENQA